MDTAASAAVFDARTIGADPTPDSSLATFHMAPDDEAPGGYKALRVTRQGASDQTRADLLYFTRYIGF